MKNNNCVIAARLATSSWSRKAPACHPEPIRQAQGKLRAKHVVEGSIVAILLAMFLTACGDSDGASANNGSATLEDVYASEDDLPGCTEKYDGAVAFVKDGSTAFKCEDGRWENKGEYYANNDAIKNCTSKREGEVAYIVDEDKSLVCEDGKWVKASDKVPEPAEPTEVSSSSNASTSSSWNEVTGSSSSIKDKGGEPAEPAEGSSSSRHCEESQCDDEAIHDSEKSSSSASKVPASDEPVESSSAEGPSSSVATDGSSSSVSLSEVSSSSVQSSSSEQSSSSARSSSSIASSSSTGIVPPCKTETEDNCEYGVLKDSRDGKEYKTVKIGDQWWMAENLNFDPGQGGAGDSTYDWSWCYDNNPSNCDKYGHLYTWAAAMDSVGVYSKNSIGCGNRKTCTVTTPARGICPEGWHIPTSAEWKTLYSAMGESPYAMQAMDYVNWPNATDAYGFAALPAGRSSINTNASGEIRLEFTKVNSGARFWSDVEFQVGYDSYAWFVGAAEAGLGYIGNPKSDGFQVRCIKD